MSQIFGTWRVVPPNIERTNGGRSVQQRKDRRLLDECVASLGHAHPQIVDAACKPNGNESQRASGQHALLSSSPKVGSR